MQVGFFFWPYSPDLVLRMGAAAERWGYNMIGIADTPGNAMDPLVAATMVAHATESPRIALCVSNIESRHPAASAAAIASFDLLAPGRAILGLVPGIAVRADRQGDGGRSRRRGARACQRRGLAYRRARLQFRPRDRAPKSARSSPSWREDTFCKVILRRATCRRSCMAR